MSDGATVRLASSPGATTSRLLKGAFQSLSRFGHARDFSLLFSEDEDQFYDYLIGLMVMSLMILSMFLFWGFLLLCFKLCFGPKRVGFLSGAPFQATIRDPSNGQVTPNHWVSWGRIVFGVSCLMFVVWAIVLVTAGIGNLEETTTTIGNGVSQTGDILSRAHALLRAITITAETVKRVRNQALVELQDFFEALKLADDMADLESAVGSLVDGMKELDDFAADLLQEISASLEVGEEACENVYTITQQVDLKALQAGLGVGLTIFPALLLGCLYWNVYGTKPNRILTNCRAFFLWPLFLLITIMSIVSCCGMCIAGLLNADFCSGGEDNSPDSTVLEIMDEVGYPPRSFEYQAVEYFVSQCDITAIEGPPPLAQIKNLEPHLNSTLAEISATLDQISSAGGVELLTDETGYNTTIVTSRLGEIAPSLNDLLVQVAGFVASLPCQPIYDVYYTITHEATCNKSYTGTFWIFMSLFLMSFFGLLAVTFRSALYPVEKLFDNLQQDSMMDEFNDERAAMIAQEGSPSDTNSAAVSKALVRADLYLYASFCFLSMGLGCAIGVRHCRHSTEG